ncbi:MAG: ABC transporter ATP-binding protein/permease [Chlorobi bacterium]|nr:ABC transporter ATP-binding protein/permease [Chlorobiota bacterium]MCI0715751.1 ABC transporter ATP-binding protein/permease [Chlorobiota bacterium]
MKNFKKLFEILGKWKYSYISAAVLLVISIGFRLLEPKVLQIAVDKIIGFFVSKGSVAASDDVVSRFLYSFLPELRIENIGIILIYLGIIFLVISLLRGATMFTSSAISASSTEKAMKKLRDKLFSHLQHLPMEYYGKTPTGELIQRCTGDVETVRKFASMQVVESVRMAAIFTGACAMMLMVNVNYALISIVLFPVVIIGSVYFFKKEGEIWTKHEAEQDKLTAMVQENLSGIRVVKAFAKENYEIEKFTAQNLRKRQWGMKLLRLHSIYWPGSDIMVYLQLAISIFAGGYFVLSNQITVGEYTAFFTYAAYVTWPMRRLAQLVSEMGMTSVAIDRIYSILNYGQEDYSGFDNEGKNLKGSIEFDNVYFKYDEDVSGILNGVSFTVSTGEKIALLGPTGAGKSTIISLLMKFYEPDRGSIKIDGRDISEYSRAFLRSKVGVVLQKPFLFSTSIKENIAYSNPDTHVEEIVESAKVANIHDIIMDIFPNAYDTVVGEKGVTLSGGQKQRVTLARTILKNPDILVLDDSTSSVDTETEYEIQRALMGITRNKTTIVIAHRVTSVQDCDRIIVLDKGRVIEQGTHDELIEKGGFYKKIYDIQVSIEDEISRETLNLRSETSDGRSEKAKVKSKTDLASTF